jgi:4-diphosphocytidyl-2-C-methyl-D-erythritol kinase
MPTSVRSHTKINLGLSIGPLRPDGFHQLTTVYQTLALHEWVTVEARMAAATRITLSSSHPRVPTDAHNTAWRIVERCKAAWALGQPMPWPRS